MAIKYGPNITKLCCLVYRNADRNATVFSALDVNSGKWLVVRRSQVDHLRVKSHQSGNRRLRAVTVAENQPFVYKPRFGHEKREREAAGIVVELGVGSRESSLGRTELLEGSVEQLDPQHAILPCGSPRDALCASKAFAALGIDNALDEDALWKELPFKFMNAIVLLRPSKWRMPTVYNSSTGSFCTNHISEFIRNASLENRKHERYVLQVYLSDTNTSLHCVAVVDRQILDPADGIWMSLSLDSFEQLRIGRIERGYLIK